MNVTVLGDGGWGTTLAIHLNRKGYNTTLWGAFPDYVNYLRAHRENVKFLPDIKIPDSINITHEIEEALSRAEVIVIAVPSQYLREVIERAAEEDLAGKLIVSASKGIEMKNLKRMSEIITETAGEKISLAALSGPSIALEVVNGAPTTLVAASSDKETAIRVQDIFFGHNIRVYTSDDVAGVELGGALKNIIAIAAGICDGLSFGSNSKSALMVRGMVEIERFGEKMGAKSQTFWGLSGIGDLITTCISNYGRNRWFGEEIGSGKSPSDALKETEMVVEGYFTAKSVYEMAKRSGIEMPITEQIYKVLYENRDPGKAVEELMTRDPKAEKGA